MKLDLNISTLIGNDGLSSGMYPVIIYYLIRQNTNEDHKISIDNLQETLIDYWKGDRDKDSAKENLRRTIKRNLTTLLYFDNKINVEALDYTPIRIEWGDSISKVHWLWYEQPLSPADLCMLSDAVVYSRHLNNERSLDLLRNLMIASGQSNPKQDTWFNNVIKDSGDISIPVTNDLYHNLEYLYDAIKKHMCVSFAYVLFSPSGRKKNIRYQYGFSPYNLCSREIIPRFWYKSLTVTTANP